MRVLMTGWLDSSWCGLRQSGVLCQLLNQLENHFFTLAEQESMRVFFAHTLLGQAHFDDQFSEGHLHSYFPINQRSQMAPQVNTNAHSRISATFTYFIAFCHPSLAFAACCRGAAARFLSSAS